jgi:hypothetical protein
MASPHPRQAQQWSSDSGVRRHSGFLVGSVRIVIVLVLSSIDLVWRLVPLRPCFDRMADCGGWPTQSAFWLEWSGLKLQKAFGN